MNSGMVGSLAHSSSSSYISFLPLTRESVTSVILAYSCCLMTYKVRRFSIAEGSLPWGNDKQLSRGVTGGKIPTGPPRARPHLAYSTARDSPDLSCLQMSYSSLSSIRYGAIVLHPTCYLAIAVIMSLPHLLLSNSL